MIKINNLRDGFSLIEMLIVISIISVMAGVAVPMFATQYNQGIREAESIQLKAFSDSLKIYAREQKKIPANIAGATVPSFDNAINSVGSSSSAQILVNQKGFNRIYLYPDNFVATANTLPYDQGALAAAGTIPAVAFTHPKVMIISPQSGNLVQTSGAITQAAFDAIWSQTGQAAELTESDTLLIERISFNEMISETILNNNDQAVSAQYSIDGLPVGNTVMAVGPAANTMFLINGTNVSLYDDLGALIYIHNVSQPMSYSFLNSTWGGALGISLANVSQAPAAISTLFTGTNGAFSSWGPKAGCVSTATPALTIDNQNPNGDMNWFYGTLGGAMTFVVKVKSQTQQTANIPECALVVIVPQDPLNGGFYMFYQGATASTVVTQ